MSRIIVRTETVENALLAALTALQEMNRDDEYRAGFCTAILLVALTFGLVPFGTRGEDVARVLVGRLEQNRTEP